MAKLSLSKDLREETKDQIDLEPHKTTRETADSKETKGPIRPQKHEAFPRQKLRISDLYPDKQLIKEAADNEYKYFLLLMFPVIIIAFFVVFQRYNLYQKLAEFLLQFF